jgi:hypothetical protein
VPIFLKNCFKSRSGLLAGECRSHLVVLIPLIECIKNQFDAAGDNYLIEYPVQVVSDGTLGHVEPLGNFAILHPTGNQPDDIFLAARQ